jgi:acetyl esterase/lipase
MKSRLKIQTVPLLAALLLAGTLGAAPEEEELLEVTLIRDIPYVAGEEVDDRQKLDLYVPKGDGPFPLMMWIHGGAWAVGHRKDEEQLARRFAERGIAVAAIDHRMSKALWIKPELDTGIEHPEHVKDCAAAFAWLVANGPERKLDRKRMFVAGFSSGAHLAALLATDPRYLKAHDLETSAIRGALPVDGTYDIKAYYELHRKYNGEKMADQHVLDVFGHGEGALEDASPTRYPGQSRVPMLVLAGKDALLYTKHLVDAVDAAGIKRFRFLDFPERTHEVMWKSLLVPDPDPARDAMIAFIRNPEVASAAAEAD